VKKVAAVEVVCPVILDCLELQPIMALGIKSLVKFTSVTVVPKYFDPILDSGITETVNTLKMVHTNVTFVRKDSVKKVT